MTDFAGLLSALNDADVEFIIVGGLAAAAHGIARSTSDLDIVYNRSPENIRKLTGAIRDVRVVRPQM